MSNRGKHASGEAGAFYRDLGIMILGIVLVGAAVFFVLYLLADDPATDTTTTTTSSTSSSVESTTTTEPEASSTTLPETTTTTVPIRPPEEVRVVVLNSEGTPGAAGRMTQRLDAAGYQTLPAHDYEPLQDPSKIWYREGFSVEANELLFFLPEAVVEAIPDEEIDSGADIVMVLGAGYEG